MSRAWSLKLHVQAGAVFLTSKTNDGGGLMVPSGFGNRPESTPVAILTQGLSKVDCVRLWFFAMKLKWTLSPTAATMVDGV